MRSVVVVLPASMCAAIPMLRVHSSGKGRSFELTDETLVLSVTTVILIGEATDMLRVPYLPTEMGEGAVGLGHLVHFFLLLHHAAGVVVGVDDLGGDGLAHRDALAAVGGVNNPAESQGLLALERDFNRNLVGGATDAAALHFQLRAGVFHRTHEQVDRITLLQLLAHLLEGAVNDALGERAFAALHDDVDEMRHQRAVIADVWDGGAMRCSSTTRHGGLKERG